MKKLYFEIHAIQNLPPSCVNRDDTGSPKTCIYGGVNRARVSSQSWKKAIREDFKEKLPKEKIGYRTKHLIPLLAKELDKLVDIKNSKQTARKLLELAGLKIKDQKDEGKDGEVGIQDTLFFISHAQLVALAKLYAENPDITSEGGGKNKDLAKKAMRQAPSLDVALFGRMVAEEPSLNTDACCQVAHAISTHPVTTEYDYFTAVDDENNVGAGHIGTTEFNSSTLYRYTTVAVHALYDYLKEETGEALEAFTRAFCLSMPKGKQNPFANRTVPSEIVFTLREDQPINLVGAFEKPICADQKGLVEPSITALDQYAEKVYTIYGKPVKSYKVGGEGGTSFDETVQQLLLDLKSYLSEEEVE